LEGKKVVKTISFEINRIDLRRWKDRTIGYKLDRVHNCRISDRLEMPSSQRFGRKNVVKTIPFEINRIYLRRWKDCTIGYKLDRVHFCRISVHLEMATN